MPPFYLSRPLLRREHVVRQLAALERRLAAGRDGQAFAKDLLGAAVGAVDAERQARAGGGRDAEAAVRGDWQIFSMIRLSDLIKVRAKTRKSQSWHKSMANKHVDFVLCDVESFEVKLVIELDEEGARFPDRVARERFLNNALYSAGLPLVRIRAENKYETASLRKTIEEALGIVKKKKKW